VGLRRPFDAIEAHDEGLVARWNAAVRPGDTV
jgi:calcineurin-like phosphoesterase family protein